MSSLTGFCSHRVSNRCSLRVCDLLVHLPPFFFEFNNIPILFFFSYRFAFVDVDDNEKALDLGCGNMGECRFRVVMALDQMESSTFPDFSGCQDCGTFLLQRRQKRWRLRMSRF